MPVNKEAEERIIKAACLLVRAEAIRLVEEENPTARTSLRLGRYLDEQTRTRVVAALNATAADLAESSLEAMKTWKPSVPPAITGRRSVLRNEHPCTKCTVVRRVAIHVLEAGTLASIECEACAPEFRGT